MRRARIVSLIALLSACGSTLNLGVRPDADAGADSSTPPAASPDDVRDAAPDSIAIPEGGAPTCGRGTKTERCRVFLTDARAEADFGGLTGGDAHCSAAAEGAGVTGRFKAYLSDGVNAAWSRFESDGPWVLMGSGEALFANRSQLKVDGPHPLDRNERGEKLEIPGHWTGVREQGFAGDSCLGFTSHAKTDRGSFGSTAPSRWLYQAYVTCETTVGFHILCLED